jgi:SnoaL-like polyketide cyclase
LDERRASWRGRASRPGDEGCGEHRSAGERGRADPADLGEAGPELDRVGVGLAGEAGEGRQRGDPQQAGYPRHGVVHPGGQAGDQVVVRVVISGTQEGPILGIPASGRHVQWDGVDIYRLSHGKISNIWAGDDWTAILNDTGTYKAPWIP